MTRRMSTRGAAVSAVIVCCLLALSACSTSPQPPAGRPSPGVTSEPGGQVSTWIFTGRALGQVLRNRAAEQVLRGDTIYRIGGDTPPASSGVKTILTVRFRSYAALHASLQAHSLPHGCHALLLDLEAWSFTPKAEQADPIRYYRMAAQDAHRQHLTLIAAPATDLVIASNPSGSGPYDSRVLASRIFAGIAEAADVISVQSQTFERDTGRYRQFVTAAAGQARAANAHVVLLAGLSSNPSGAAVSTAQLTAALRAVRGVVAGFWMNIPSPGPACPGCRAAAPQVAAGALGAAG